MRKGQIVSAKKKCNFILMIGLTAGLMLSFHGKCYGEEKPLDQIDKLLELPEPDIPAGLDKSDTAGDKARQIRISKSIKELFKSSPLVSPKSGSLETSKSKNQPKNQPDTLGLEMDGWTVTKGTTLTFYQSPSAASCRADCAKKTTCAGYTWVKLGGYKAGDAPMCYLMSSIEKTAPHTCCITATKTNTGNKIKMRDSASKFKGRWRWEVNCPNGTVSRGQWMIMEYDPMGPFKGKFEGSKKHIGVFEGVTGDTGSEYGGIFFTQKKSGARQKWMGEFSNPDQTIIKGNIKDLIQTDCSFTARKCFDSQCASFEIGP